MLDYGAVDGEAVRGGGGGLGEDGFEDRGLFGGEDSSQRRAVKKAREGLRSVFHSSLACWRARSALRWRMWMCRPVDGHLGGYSEEKEGQ